MAQAARPPSGQILDHTPSAGPSRTALDRSDSSPGLGSLQLVGLTASPVIEGILGPNKDGRIRNAVPSKLKGKTDNKQGNFGVMHMGMNPTAKKSEAISRDVAAERDAAARKTSENTESRAKAAQQQKYAPPKKKGLEATLNEATRSTNRGSPFAKDDRRQQRPLAPDETKMEQARLLTLLRSINPVTVVDQICKAVAYFGGIPGAPPPEDGIFPESANTRETGALFIGWLAEIFPDLTARSPEVQKSDPKKRNRPSKGPKNELSIEAPNSSNGYGYGPAVAAPAWGLPTNLAEVNPQAPSVPEGAIGPGVEQTKPIAQQPSTPLRQQEDGGINTTSAGKRRRGRPKGSTNKNKKTDGQAVENAAGSNNLEFDGQNQSGVRSVPEAGVSTTNATKKGQPAFQSNAPQPAQDLQYSDQAWQSDSQKNQIGSAPAIPQDGLSPEERAVLEAFRHHNPETVGAVNALPSPVVSTKGPTETGQPAKRKRAPPKPKAIPPSPASAAATNTSTIPGSTPSTTFPVQTTQQMPQHRTQQVQDSSSLSTFNNEPVMGMSKDAIQWPSVEDATPTAPPAKRPRQRKPKVPNSNDTPSRNQATSAVSSATPPIAPSTIPDSAAGSSQQSIQQTMPASRPPVEGLEALYERFGTLQHQQQNGRSHTPTQPQQPQHVRQPPNPPSAPPPQTTPQMPQQIQHQKSQSGGQQGLQRDDQSIAQGGSSRSSTGYYNQRSNSTSYNQQYPSHQPSQIYSGHTASPQMSNSSYRTSSSHTMAQASPQFSQAENAYRTASPHTLSNPSPSFSQTENQFRPTNAHSLAQPSQPYSQAENAYRAPSTNSTMTQPSQSFSTSTTRSQQPTHYSNQFSDSSYLDLPTLDSIGHSSSSNLGGYGQPNLNLNSHSRSSGSTSSLYGTSSGLGNSYDVTGGANDLLRVSRGSVGGPSTGHGAYGSTGAYETGNPTEHDLREKLLRNIGRR